MMPSFKYFDVQLIQRKPKTNVYAVISKHGDTLGIIKWFRRWRQYCFFPNSECVFSKGCLADIQKVLEDLKR